SQTNVTCNGLSNGSVTVAGGGGAGSYTYLWSGGAAAGKNTPTVSGLSASPPVYSCKITDANSCNTTVNVTITQPAVLALTISTFQNLTCYDGSNAIIQANPTGGTAPYSYTWTSTGPPAAIAAIAGQIGQQATNLPQGTYQCQINDANGCGTSSPVKKTIQYLFTWN